MLGKEDKATSYTNRSMFAGEIDYIDYENHTCWHAHDEKSKPSATPGSTP